MLNLLVATQSAGRQCSLLFILSSLVSQQVLYYTFHSMQQLAVMAHNHRQSID